MLIKKISIIIFSVFFISTFSSKISLINEANAIPGVGVAKKGAKTGAKAAKKGQKAAKSNLKDQAQEQIQNAVDKPKDGQAAANEEKTNEEEGDEEEDNASAQDQDIVKSKKADEKSNNYLSEMKEISPVSSIPTPKAAAKAA